MRVLLTGGGTGGHITPLLAVAQKLKADDPHAKVLYVGDRAGGRKFAALTDNKLFDEQHLIWAGKFRRYHGESWPRRLLDVKTNLLNLRDLFYFGIGTVQASLLLRRLHPDVILLKGGFVGVPVGLAAALQNIPFITHDSDALPGLANRSVARWARYHATALPEANYDYPRAATRQVGVLVGEDYQPVTAAMQKKYRAELDLPDDAKVLLITGGSSGAQNINDAFVAIVPDLLEDHPKLHVIHQVGPGNEALYDSYNNERLSVAPLLIPLANYSGAADVIVTRAGANTLAEFGVQGKACIVVPNPILTGGHQLKNAELLADKQAIEVFDEAKLSKPAGREELAVKITTLLGDEAKRHQLGQALQAGTIRDAAQRLAKLLIEVGKNGR